jgi:hypothetical protein
MILSGRRKALLRKDLRCRYPVVVRLRCGRCDRIVGECYGDAETMLSACWSESGGTVEGFEVGHFVGFGTRAALRCRCPCGADYPLSGGKLAAAFATKAAAAAKRDRVIVLPADLGR